MRYAYRFVVIFVFCMSFLIHFYIMQVCVQFLSRIDRYEDRLKALFYKKKYHERMNDAVPKVRGKLLKH